jgi:hypothetical protein
MCYYRPLDIIAALTRASAECPADSAPPVPGEVVKGSLRDSEALMDTFTASRLSVATPLRGVLIVRSAE